MNLVQPEDEEEDTEVILNKADEIESLQVGNNKKINIKYLPTTISKIWIYDIPPSTNFPVFFYWLLTATALQQPIKTLENCQKDGYKLGIQNF